MGNKMTRMVLEILNKRVLLLSTHLCRSRGIPLHSVTTGTYRDIDGKRKFSPQPAPQNATQEKQKRAAPVSYNRLSSFTLKVGHARHLQRRGIFAGRYQNERVNRMEIDCGVCACTTVKKINLVTWSLIRLVTYLQRLVHLSSRSAPASATRLAPNYFIFRLDLPLTKRKKNRKEDETKSRKPACIC